MNWHGKVIQIKYSNFSVVYTCAQNFQVWSWKSILRGSYCNCSCITGGSSPAHIEWAFNPKVVNMDQNTVKLVITLNGCWICSLWPCPHFIVSLVTHFLCRPKTVSVPTAQRTSSTPSTRPLTSSHQHPSHQHPSHQHPSLQYVSNAWTISGTTSPQGHSGPRCYTKSPTAQDM